MAVRSHRDTDAFCTGMFAERLPQRESWCLALSDIRYHTERLGTLTLRIASGVS
jgi:hypothetical protein